MKLILRCHFFPPGVWADRKKDLVKLQAGEYVSLGKVEAELKTCAVVENICVYGDSSKQFTVALVVPNQKHLVELAIKQGVAETDFEKLCALPVMEKAVIKELAEHARKCKYFLHRSIDAHARNFLIRFVLYYMDYVQVNYKSTKCPPPLHYAKKSGRRTWDWSRPHLN